LFFNIQGLHNRLQSEKATLQAAVQACEAAVASVSRPGTPLTAAGGGAMSGAPEKEVQIKLKLEDLIDKVWMEGCFSWSPKSIVKHT
jgi:hypothetical protein